MEKPKEKNLVSSIANIISTVVLVISIAICVLVIISMKSSTGVANLFGYSVLSVRSNSMEPVFQKNDLIVIRMTKPTDRFKEGDIISFVSFDSAGTRFVNTHRIVHVDKGNTRDRYTTKGDNAIANDRKKLYSNSIIGQYTGKKIEGVGKYVDFVNSPTGVLLCVVIPSAIIIIAQVINYVTAAGKRKRQMLLEAEERARQERIQLVNDVVAAQRGAAGGVYVQTPAVNTDVQFDEPEKQRVIQEFLQKQAQEEAKKQAIIEEYLYKQKQAEQAAKEEAEAAKIKAIISEFLAQQHQTEDGNPAPPPADASAQEDEQA